MLSISDRDDPLTNNRLYVRDAERDVEPCLYVQRGEVWFGVKGVAHVVGKLEPGASMNTYWITRREGIVRVTFETDEGFMVNYVDIQAFEDVYRVTLYPDGKDNPLEFPRPE